MLTVEPKSVVSAWAEEAPTGAPPVPSPSPTSRPGALKRLFSIMGKALTKTRLPEMSPELRTAVSRVVRDEHFEEWLRLPNKLLNGKSPAELLKQSQEDLIWKAIDQVKHGEGS